MMRLKSGPAPHPAVNDVWKSLSMGNLNEILDFKAPTLQAPSHKVQGGKTNLKSSVQRPRNGHALASRTRMRKCILKILKHLEFVTFSSKDLRCVRSVAHAFLSIFFAYHWVNYFIVNNLMTGAKCDKKIEDIWLIERGEYYERRDHYRQRNFEKFFERCKL